MLKIAKLIICKTCFFCKRYLFAIDWMMKTINIGFVFKSQLKEMIINPIITGGGHICPPHHVFAYTRVCMRIRVLIFCDFSSF